MASRLVVFVCLLAACGLLGCEATPAPVDAAAPIDAFERRDAPLILPDGGPPCTLSCGTSEACCWTEGTETCVLVGADIHHCGACGNDCEATERGDDCQLGRCTCGDIDIGCLGAPHSACCVSATGRGHCADFLLDFTDCGGCNLECNATLADRCVNGECRCGATAACGAGGACCPPRFGGGESACADLATDRENCGACGTTCRADEACRDGVCTLIRDAGPLDGGALDAGRPDADLADAGTPDAGTLDAGGDAP